MKEYFRGLNNLKKHHPYVKKIEEEAIKNNIPIISQEGLCLLLQLVKINKVFRFLEIGTAIGYTAINVAMVNDNIYVDSIERDKEMYLKALENIRQVSLNKRINIFHNDALDIDIKDLHNSYDLIFIDAAKAQYQKFFVKYEPLLSDHGLIVCDNLLFHGLVEKPDLIKSKNLRSLVLKIKKFNEWLANYEKYQTLFLEIGDGMAVSVKK